MSRCLDKNLGDLLHAWELDLLTEEQCREFEVHLLECPACQESAAEFSKAARLLRENQLVRAEAEKADRKFSPVFIRWALAAVIILGIGVPTYIHWSGAPNQPPEQQLIFYPMRSSGNRTIDLSTKGEVEFVFLAPEDASNHKLTLVVETVKGEEIYRSDNFSDIDEHGAGSFVLPADDFTAGFFRLRIITPEGDTTTFGFRAE
jgi:hypothetical protein